MTSKAGNSRITHFEILFADSFSRRGELYANGRHQCEVLIKIAKEVKDKSGVWTNVPLTASECSSITVTMFSSNSDQMLLAGWSCDDVRNTYDLGIWDRDLGRSTYQVSEALNHDTHVTRVYRYIRFEPMVPIESATFMARIVLDEEVYTSSSVNSGAGENAVVTITPVRPFRLDAEDLEWHVDGEAYDKGGASARVYYWIPPTGVSFIENRGLDNSLELKDEGDNFNTFSVWGIPGTSSTIKGGVVVNKDSFNAPLYMNDVHKGLALPVPNPTIVFNKKRTIMRALVLSAVFSEPDAHEGSVWRLLDNFGNEQVYFIRWVGGEPILSNYKNVRLNTYSIVTPTGQDATGELYSNGRHQVKLVINLVVEQEDENGYWHEVALTLAERASATVTLYSRDENEKLPPGWSCDKEKNIYDAGLWRGSLSTTDVGQKESTERVISRTSPYAETIERYMRVDQSRPIETHRFMAKIIIGEKIYTTNQPDTDSYVSITPTRPYVLRSDQLTRYWDDGAYWNSRTNTDVDGYRWVPPSGLRFLVNKGLDRPLYFAYEGERIQSAWCNRRRNDNIWSKGGVLMINNASGEKVRLKDLHGVMPELNEGLNPEVRFDLSITPMCAVRIAIRVFLGDADSRSPWRMVDNFGCEHAFLLASGPDGHELLLYDY
ncbi:hypothetical protein ACEK06_05400 [Pseudomonas brenneri]|uniref:hypothetical protein n=1 Tax=Pseudomonas brenneri TaxID=129817 RepID=UPI0035709F55